MTSKSKTAFFLICLFLLSAFALAQNDSGKIAFLTFKYDGDKMTLVNSRVVDGTFKAKTKEFKTGDLRYEIAGGDKTAVSQNFIDNPLVKKLEYEDPDNPGQLVSKIVTLPEAEFTIRIDYSQKPGYIRFYKTTAILDKGAAASSLINEIPIGNLAEKSAGGTNEK